MAFNDEQLANLRSIMNIHENMADQQELAHEYVEALQDIMDLQQNMTEKKDVAHDLVMNLDMDNMQAIARKYITTLKRKILDAPAVKQNMADEHTSALQQDMTDEQLKHVKAAQQMKAEKDLAVKHASAFDRPLELQRSMARKKEMAHEQGLAFPYDFSVHRGAFLHTVYIYLSKNNSILNDSKN